MTKEEARRYYIELQGGMYGNVDSALLYFGRFTEYATDENGLNLEQSLRDPCVFYKKNEAGRITAIVVVYVDDCLIAGETDAIQQIKTDLKREFGVVEDGQLRKLLGVRYRWETNEDDTPIVILNMEDKANEIIKAYEDARGEVKKTFTSPGQPDTVLSVNETEIVMHGSYRSILGKIMFMLPKLLLSVALRVDSLPSICTILVKSIGTQWRDLLAILSRRKSMS